MAKWNKDSFDRIADGVRAHMAANPGEFAGALVSFNWERPARRPAGTITRPAFGIGRIRVRPIPGAYFDDVGAYNAGNDRPDDSDWLAAAVQRAINSILRQIRDAKAKAAR